MPGVLRESEQGEQGRTGRSGGQEPGHPSLSTQKRGLGFIARTIGGVTRRGLIQF